ncbi:MAG: hypothetical protein HMLKMBBP_01227 [Planctomycetes bacterium]|nr:hypothetical protein [Planctomycetota bacterium]
MDDRPTTLEHPLRLSARVAAFLALLAAATFGLDAGLWALRDRGVRLLPEAPPSEVDLLYAGEGRVLYLGDSVVGWIPADEPGAASLGGLVAETSPRPVALAASAGRGPHYVAAQLDLLLARGIRPACVVVPVNLQSFGPTWERNPRVQAEDLRRAFTSGTWLPTRALFVLKVEFGQTSFDEWLQTPVVVAGRVRGNVRSMEHDESLPAEVLGGRRLVARYAADLGVSRWLPLLSAAVERVAAAGIPVVVYITPVHPGHPSHAVDPADRAAISANLDILAARFSLPGVTFRNFGRGLSHEDFDSSLAQPNGHLRLDARRRLAASIAEAIRAAVQVTR